VAKGGRAEEPGDCNVVGEIDPGGEARS
jgi:hypothetical protein